MPPVPWVQIANARSQRVPLSIICTETDDDLGEKQCCHYVVHTCPTYYFKDWLDSFEALKAEDLVPCVHGVSHKWLIGGDSCGNCWDLCGLTLPYEGILHSCWCIAQYMGEGSGGGGGVKYASIVMMSSSWFCMEVGMSKHFKEGMMSPLTLWTCLTRGMTKMPP